MLIQRVNLTRPVHKDAPLNERRVVWFLPLPGQIRGSVFRDLIDNNNGLLAGGWNSSSRGWRISSGPGGFGCILFNANTGYVNIGNPLVYNFGSNSFTLSIIFQSSFATGSLGFSTTSGASAQGVDFLVASGAVAGNVLIRGINNSGTTTSGTLWTGTNDGYFHMITAVFDRVTNVLTTYGDGKLLGTVSGLSGTYNASGPAQIGARNGAQLVSGSIRDVSIWDRTLSAGEAAALWTEAKRGYPGTLNWLVPQAAFVQVGGTVYMQTCSATAGQTATLVRSTNKILAGSSGQSGSLVKSCGKRLTGTVGQTATIIRACGKILSASSPTVASMVRTTNKFLTSTQGNLATLAGLKARLQTCVATAGSTATLVRSTLKSVIATQASGASLRKAVSKTVGAASTPVPTLTKAVAKVLIVASLTVIATLIALSTAATGLIHGVVSAYADRHSTSAYARKGRLGGGKG